MIPRPANPPAFHIITGGPGSGKTTLIDALALEGFHYMPEAGRAIIRDQVAIGGTALPWSDRAAFAELMLAWELLSWHEAHARAGPVIFDRGVPDVSGYLRVSGLPVPAHLSEAARLFRYQPRVFIAPPWRAIFMADAERRQDFAEAEATYEAMVAVYTELGYELMMLPFAPVTERACFVRSAIAGDLD
ncbi:AAA family ATPase [Sphingobium scionense]|uniref:Putative ATPase n=1 Tax=Sphingobium scionense TaxID=1404341 RepID=A0A7W6LV63_9SPHN|nr:putative ATPase [Sphingobium scionense]